MPLFDKKQPYASVEESFFVHLPEGAPIPGLFLAMKERLAILLKQITHFRARQSSLELFKRRYFSEKSYIDQLDEWYHQKNWFGFGKEIKVLSFIAMSALVGAIFQLTIAFTLIAFALYKVVDFVLGNYHRVSTAQREGLWNDIVQMEEGVTKEMEQLMGMEKQLNQLSLELMQEQLQMGQENSQFKAMVVSLQEEMQQLTKIKEDLLQKNAEFVLKIDQFQEKFTRLQQDMQEKYQEITLLTEQLEQTQRAIEEVQCIYQRKVQDAESHSKKFTDEIQQHLDDCHEELADFEDFLNLDGGNSGDRQDVLVDNQNWEDTCQNEETRGSCFNH